MRGSLARRTLSWSLHYGLLFIYVLAALFPLYWLVKVSITPNDILYTHGIDLWPSRISWEHYATVIGNADFLLFFRNSIIVSGVTAIASTLLATASGYAFSRFAFRGKFWIVGPQWTGTAPAECEVSQTVSAPLAWAAAVTRFMSQRSPER